MSRAKSRQNIEACGDCGSIDATWASVNKGILLCTQCCSVHRSLGRHISQVKSIQKSDWNANQLAMVNTLNNNAANNVWEHLLFENGSKLLKKKPTARDPLPVKTEFIKAKHQQCLYAVRPSYEDGLLSVENELGKQLHGSVRTPNLETSFRLLALGADPNYFHDEKATTPLHVAVKTEQKLQVELLLVHGANPNYPDAFGKTPIDYAKQNVNQELANRLIECQYEMTDAFSYYLTLKKPNHVNGIHYLIPQTGFKSNPSSLSKLQKLPNHVFQELCVDVYDELDRRETEGIWLSCVDSIGFNAVPFLPVDPTLSTTRNQGRQKLARFSSPELKSLVYDILIDTQRRQLMGDKGRSVYQSTQTFDEDPLYDSVASDEDYAVLPSHEDVLEKTDFSDFSSIAVKLSDKKDASAILETLTKKLQDSDNMITDLKAENNKLKTFLEDLKTENDALKSRLSQKIVCNNGESNFQSLDSFLVNQSGDSKSPQNGKSDGPIDLRCGRTQRPSSMYETREGIKVPNWQTLKNQLKNESARNSSPFASPQERQNLMQCTEQITRSIQHLVKSIHDYNKDDDCVECAEKVKNSISKLSPHLSQESDGDTIKAMWEILSTLRPACLALQSATRKGDSKAIEHNVVQIRECAFHLAKCTKEIVTKYSYIQ